MAEKNVVCCIKIRDNSTILKYKEGIFKWQKKKLIMVTMLCI